MSQLLYSVEQVAQRLGLHVKTVRGYVREGRLKAVRIGKQYRIAREDFEALTGQARGGADPDTVRRQRHVEASSIVEIDPIGPDDASRITNSLLAAAKGRRTATRRCASRPSTTRSAAASRSWWSATSARARPCSR